ncbi:MAG: hypothetical protein ABSG62_02240 [Terracidiphilus sp.]|jgi:hypothetical protein
MRKPPSASSTRTPGRWISQTARQALCLALLLVLPGGAQNGPGSTPRGSGVQPIGQRVGGGLEEMGTVDPIEAEKRLRALNAERQKSMVSDTNKLLKLASELNAEISGENPDSLTPAQLSKLAEIEKLAHRVKDKMSTSVRGVPVFQQPTLRIR